MGKGPELLGFRTYGERHIRRRPVETATAIPKERGTIEGPNGSFLSRIVAVRDEPKRPFGPGSYIVSAGYAIKGSMEGSDVGPAHPEVLLVGGFKNAKQALEAGISTYLQNLIKDK